MYGEKLLKAINDKGGETKTTWFTLNSPFIVTISTLFRSDNIFPSVLRQSTACSIIAWINGLKLIRIDLMSWWGFTFSKSLIICVKKINFSSSRTSGMPRLRYLSHTTFLSYIHKLLYLCHLRESARKKWKWVSVLSIYDPRAKSPSYGKSKTVNLMGGIELCELVVMCY